MTSTVHASPSSPFPLDRDVALSRPVRSARTESVTDELAHCDDPLRESQLREELICLHLGVASSIASRYNARGVDGEDLQQVAYLALTKAAQRFDPSTGHPFMAFAVPTIRGEVRRHFRDHGWVVRPPRRVQDLQYRLWTTEARLSQERGRTPTPRELAEELDAPLDDVLETLDSGHCFTPASLDRPVGEDGGGASLGDLLPQEDPSFVSAEARALLGDAVTDLGERDRHILKLRFFDGLTQAEIADEVGVTQVQVSRLLARIYRDLRRQLGPLD